MGQEKCGLLIPLNLGQMGRPTTPRHSTIPSLVTTMATIEADVILGRLAFHDATAISSAAATGLLFPFSGTGVVPLRSPASLFG